MIAGRRKPKAYAAETAGSLQRIEVFTRDDFRCRFEVAVTGLPQGQSHFDAERIVEWDGDVAWTRCNSTRLLETVHIHRRHKLGSTMTDDGIELALHPCVAICGCRLHHQMFDSRQYRDRVRVPPGAVATARELIEHTYSSARARGEYVVDVDLSNL